MKISILYGSLRDNSNTKKLLLPFMDELKRHKAELDFITVKNLHIEPCTACWVCQDIFSKPGCPKNDDMNLIYDSVQKADCIVFASPVYSWYCTPPFKAVMDRLVYGMNKYYGKEPGPCLWKNKKLALITTCGYEIEAGAGVFEEGVRRYAKHSNLHYLGMLAVRDIESKTAFTNDKTVKLAKQFANKVISSLE